MSSQSVLRLHRIQGMDAARMFEPILRDMFVKVQTHPEIAEEALDYLEGALACDTCSLTSRLKKVKNSNFGIDRLEFENIVTKRLKLPLDCYQKLLLEGRFKAARRWVWSAGTYANMVSQFVERLEVVARGTSVIGYAHANRIIPVLIEPFVSARGQILYLEESVRNDAKIESIIQIDKNIEMRVKEEERKLRGIRDEARRKLGKHKTQLIQQAVPNNRMSQISALSSAIVMSHSEDHMQQAIQVSKRLINDLATTQLLDTNDRPLHSRLESHHIPSRPATIFNGDHTEKEDESIRVEEEKKETTESSPMAMIHRLPDTLLLVIKKLGLHS